MTSSKLEETTAIMRLLYTAQSQAKSAHLTIEGAMKGHERPVDRGELLKKALTAILKAKDALEALGVQPYLGDPYRDTESSRDPT